MKHWVSVLIPRGDDGVEFGEGRDSVQNLPSLDLQFTTRVVAFRTRVIIMFCTRV